MGPSLRKGRPRKRYIGERRHEITRYAIPTLSVASILTAAVAALDVTLSSFPPRASATAALGISALVFALGAIVVFLARKHLVVMQSSIATAGALALLSWGVACHETGGAASPYILVLPAFEIALAVAIPLSARAAVVIALASYVGLAIASLSAPAYVHAIIVVVAIGSVVFARARHVHKLETFVRTERLAARLQRLRRLQEQLIIVEKLEALRVLVGGMAHELNNALAISVASNQQATRDMETNAALAKAALARSDGGLERIKRTVDRLRRFAMASEGKLEPADVAAMLDFALESAIGRARSGVIVERHYAVDVGAIECHVSALAEALFQIARNAIEAMPGGGTIDAAVSRKGDSVILSVSDQGGGIPADQIAHVFDPFYSRGRKGQKSGLGLSAVYGLVTALGGKVEIQSEVGKGTTVAIIMPSSRAK